MPADAELIAAVRAGLHELADPARAPGMAAYMKSTMPCLGVRLPQVRGIVRAAARERPPRTTAELRDTVLKLWREAAYREERYAATALLNAPGVRRLREPDLITLYQELIVTGAWWDHVDEVSGRVGELLLEFPAQIRPVVAGWQRSTDRWLRRTSIICQRSARDRTDLALLTGAIEANADDRDFFLRKAIGWALRSYAYTDPEWVRAFVSGHKLSPLSVREATKHL
ncbi:MAG TPA: DNA alkylation repair protein [Jatrophihabitans sp.]|jgi:3-methyladenine DNA glycosylase AlkD|nr:DNA alkylation repair protein [Jatrophihabitans sp.]